MRADRAVMTGAARGVASTSIAANCTDRDPTTARMHTISRAARSPCSNGSRQRGVSRLGTPVQVLPAKHAAESGVTKGGELVWAPGH